MPNLCRSQYSVIGSPGTYSITKYGRPFSVAPASYTLAIPGWSIRARACRSDSNRATTSRLSIPLRISLRATMRRTGSVCSACQTSPMPPSPSRCSRRYGPTTLGTSSSRRTGSCSVGAMSGGSVGWLPSSIIESPGF